VGEALLSDIFGQARKAADPLALLLGDSEPAKPFCFISAGPKASVASPKPSRVTVTPPRFERVSNQSLKFGRKRDDLIVELLAQQCSTFLRDRAEQLVERVSKSCTPSSTSVAITVSMEMPDRSNTAIVSWLARCSLQGSPVLPVIAERNPSSPAEWC